VTKAGVHHLPISVAVHIRISLRENDLVDRRWEELKGVGQCGGDRAHDLHRAGGSAGSWRRANRDEIGSTRTKCDGCAGHSRTFRSIRRAGTLLSARRRRSSQPSREE
jgi:hypothetical protein